MLTQVEALVVGVTAPDFPVTDGPATDPIQIRNIDGLGPVKAAVNTTQYGSVDGEFYTGSYVGARNIVLTVGLNPSWADQTFESLRRILLGYFLPGAPIKLVFTSTHMPQVKIEGFVESFEPNIFSKDPEIQVSIICPKPYFVAVAQSAITGVTTAFTDTTLTEIDYDGDVEVGYVMDFSIQAGGATLSNGEVRIVNNTPSVQLLSVKNVNVDSTHSVRVSTVQGAKFARQIPLPSGNYTNVLGKVVPGSIWAPILKGVNYLQVMSSNPGQTWTLSYYALYGGL